MIAKEQLLARYPDAYCFKFSATQNFEIWAKSRKAEGNHPAIFWNGKTPIHAWQQALKILNQELLKRFES